MIVLVAGLGAMPELYNADMPSSSAPPMAAGGSSDSTEFHTSPSKLFYQMVQTSSGLAAQHVEVCELCRMSRYVNVCQDMLYD